MSSSTVAPLRALLRIIEESIEKIEDSCRSRGLDFPVLDEPFTPESDAARRDPIVQYEARLITAASYQLIATVQQPQTTLFSSTCSYYLPVSLRAAVEVNAVEILREAGPEGLHVKDIASKTNVDPEIRPDVYANNRISSVCDTGKSVHEILTKPEEKHVGTNGIAAFIGKCTDEDYKGAGFVLEHLIDPVSAFEDGPDYSPMMRAFGSDKGVWEWLEQPSNKMRLQRFGIAMHGVNNMQPPDAILRGFDCKSLPSKAIVVDVGGGIGASALSLAKAYPELQLIIQDRPSVIEQGKKHCGEILPDALDSGRVKYEAHDFFEPQPNKEASVFLLKQIVHDWSDRYAAKILQQLRDAATPETKLIIIDSIIPYSCAVDDSSIPGFEYPRAPAPLLANLGAANILPYIVDMSMNQQFNALERTIDHMKDLLVRAGWRLERVYSSDLLGGYLPHIVGVPI